MDDNDKQTLRMAIGDLGPAYRHLERLRSGAIPVSGAVLSEAQASIERCIERLSKAVDD